VKTTERLWLKCRCGYSRSIPCHPDEPISAVAERKRWRFVKRHLRFAEGHWQFVEGYWQCPTCEYGEGPCALSDAG